MCQKRPMSGRLKCSEPKRLRCYRLVRMSYDDDISTNYRQMSKCRLSPEPAIPSSLSAGKTSFASEETSSGATSTRISPSSQERNVLRQLGLRSRQAVRPWAVFVVQQSRMKRGKTASILRCRAWIAVLTASLTTSRATAQRLGAKKKRANTSHGLSTNCTLSCHPIVGEE
jgi:hypothetical protein